MKKILLEVSFSKIYMIVMIIITLLILGGYFSYAMFTVSKERDNAISIVTGNLTYKLEVDGVEENSLVVEPNSSKEFIVKLTNPNNRIARFNSYYLGDIPNNVEAGYIIDCETNTLPEAKGINLEKVNTTGSSNTYKIVVTNESDSEISIELGVNVGLDYNDLELQSNGHLFTEYIYNEPNAPELDEGMIAVTYNGSEWVKADTSNTDSNWYNYDELKWANAVTVSSTTRDTYKSASVGTVVNMDDIETMWVWIPRYSYSIGSVDGTNYYGKQGEYLSSSPTQELPGEIDVKFVPAGEKDRCSAKYNVGEEITSWYTPDGFTFDNQELSGIWVGKFETSSSNPNAEYGGGNTTELDSMIKPNVTSWRRINVSNAFNVSLKMNDTGNRYGFSNNIETRVIKNSEWALVTYLSQSKYGKLGNTKFSGANKEIYQNKSDQYITGCSYGSPPDANVNYGCPYTYDIEGNGTGASTTGNIYGIYDMSGGAWDYVMGNHGASVGNSGFTSMPEAKYYDKYTGNDILKACDGNECISHNLSETIKWYGSGDKVSTDEFPWMLCGAFYQQENSSLFRVDASNSYGSIHANTSFRLVINKNDN